ncbi:MAG: rhodanese-like domain-containing protein [Desulfuromonadales bacterium]
MAAGYAVIGHAELKALVDSNAPAFLLVDARNPEEYHQAHIPGAINIPVAKFERFTGLLPADKNTMLVFYCNGVKCGKSKKAAEKALQLGYANVHVFAEGMPVWEELGYNFYKGGDYEKRIETTKISPGDLKKLMDSQPETLQIVDVRDAEEFAEGHIPGAINIPLNTFASKSGILDKSKKVVVYCNSGGRSYDAYRKLMKLGYKDIAQTIFADWKAAGLPVEK